MCQLAAAPERLHAGHVRMLALAGHVRRAGKALSAGGLAAEWAAVDAVKAAAGEPAVEAARRLLDAQAGDVLARLPEAAVELALAAAAVAGLQAQKRDDARRAADDAAGVVADLVFDVGRWAREAAEALSPALADALGEGFRAGALRVAYDAPVRYQPSARTRAVVGRLVEKAEGTAATTRAELARVISGALVGGADAGGVGRAVAAAFEDWQGWRAEAVGRTAAAGAFGAAQQDAFVDGGVEQNAWLSQRDGDVRASHDAIDGEAVAVGEPFSNGLTHPGDPAGDAAEVVNCRCDVLPILGPAAKGRPAGKARGRAWRVERDRAIKARWEELCRRYDSSAAMERAREEFVEAGHAISLRTVERACYGR